MRPARDVKHSSIYKLQELDRIFFKKILYSGVNPKIFTYPVFFCKFGSIARRKTYCFLTKKPRSVFSKFKLSRIAFRELVMFGGIYGVFKVSW